jgi:cell wall-associated NlpC family hydrolase
MVAGGRHPAVRGVRGLCWLALAALLGAGGAIPGTVADAASGTTVQAAVSPAVLRPALPASGPSAPDAATRPAIPIKSTRPTSPAKPIRPAKRTRPARPAKSAESATPAGPGAASGLDRIIGVRAAELARAAARVAALGAALTGLRTHAEILAEHYDQEVLLQQQDGAAYRAALARVAVAKRTERTDRLRLAQQAAADYEGDGGPDMAVAMAAAVIAPQPYLSTLGVQQVLDSQRADLLAASAADEIVTQLFAQQAATALTQQRTASQAASFLKQAVTAAVTRQTGVIKTATAARARLTTALAAARSAAANAAAANAAAANAATAVAANVAARLNAAAARLAAGGQPPAARLAELTASVRAGGPPGASPGVTAPAWSAAAGASAQQGDEAADWALTQVGKPYQWGAAGPASYDCSGLAMEAWARAGVALLHWTGYQWVAGPHVPLAQLRRGDLVFYATNSADPATIHHVGIYLGAGLMVDAPYTGASVRIDSIFAYAGLIGATRPARAA